MNQRPSPLPVGAAVRARRIGLLGAALALAGALVSVALAQPTMPANGPRRVDPAWHALVHATLIPEPGQLVKDATIVLRDGQIVSVEAGAAPPAGARIWDCTGLNVYSGLVEAYWPVEVARPDPAAPGTHWNKNVLAQRWALLSKSFDADQKKKLRENGFAVAAIAPRGGVLRGVGSVVSLGEPGGPTGSSDPMAGVIVPRAFHTLSLNTDPESGDYPNSKMGAIALIRQMLADAPWRARAVEANRRDPVKFERPEPSDALDALNEPLPLLFDVDNELDDVRASKIATEFGRPAVLVTGGTEYKRLNDALSAGRPIVTPLLYPDKPRAGTEAERDSVSLRELMAWEAAPSNAARLAKASKDVAITSSKLPKEQQFFANLRTALLAGLTEDQALAMLTTNPARILGLDKRLGRVAPGMAANLVVVKRSLFDGEREIRDVWVDGVRYEVNRSPKVDLEGEWAATFTVPAGASAPDSPARTVEGTMKLRTKGRLVFERPVTDDDKAREKAEKEKAAAERKARGEKPAEAKDAAPEAKPEPKKDDANAKPETRTFDGRNYTLNDYRPSFVLDGKALGLDGPMAVSGVAEGSTLSGTVTLPGGKTAMWTATRKDPAQVVAKDEDKREDPDDPDRARMRRERESVLRVSGVPETFGAPFGPFALKEPPKAADMWITGATIWTSGPAGVIADGVLHVEGGKVKAVYDAKRMPKIAIPANAVKIDARGKHITPGLIDCHSHTAISGGVNEGGQAVTAEVRIGDVVDPDAINIYRELAGGLTTMNQLHGSANAIGGQNNVSKLRWGAPGAEAMKLEGAVGGIKFALGENPRAVNWNAPGSRDRYPQTRMGVETLIRDRFTAAREYASKWKAWNAFPKAEQDASVPPRRDLELEPLAEVLAGTRLVHCHSYRQDEILMLCRVAADFGFTIGTFQHVLEGYKVAEAIKQHALGGSSFSDWWAYKFEVYDAIPYNGAIMWEQGVTVSFNSDSDELARRMAPEAAKAVKYGGVPPEEALKFVTLNPAKQLKIDSRVGSLEAGKDADFVIWSGSPLSSISRCEATYIDGAEYFSLTRDAALRAEAAATRQRIMQKLLTRPGREFDQMAAAPASAPASAPAPGDFARSGRGMGLVPVGGDEDLDDARRFAARQALEQHYNWLILNGLDPTLSHRGDCGCASQCLFQIN